ncbi:MULTISPECIES: DUF6311 domain-containing protein [unclassified Anaeromyxobacter]|uniref:DUF6311 domain-containing protein n=1 Tax=unclassified Anaeromyxobacter TaxID=2620896 RepID=UPI001F56D007|nr:MULTISPECIES: DUF6311 domain-containing protein [unclassified Anaeromyxobacter]
MSPGAPDEKGSAPGVPAGRAGGRLAPLRARLAPHAPALVAGLAGVGWLAWNAGGLALAAPGNVRWLLGSDFGASYVGWLFFRSAPFELPLGANPLYPFGVGSTLGFTDSLPLVAVVLRPLAALLPQDFQYVGSWLVVAFALQGFVGAKLARLATPDRVAQALGGALFVLAPPLLHRLVGPRTGHASLCAQWILLLALWLALAPAREDAPRLRARVAAALLLVLAAAGVHPYFVVMASALAAALLARIVLVERRGGASLLAGGLAAIALAAGAGLALFGFLVSGVRARANGFGYFSADLATLVNPMGWSRVWAGLPVHAGQYEGFGYLGAGVLLLLVLGAVLAAARRRPPAAVALARVAPIVVIALVLGFFALSGTVRAAGEVVGRLRFYEAVPALSGTFRSSGRFVWPLHYLLLLGGIGLAAVALGERPRALRGVLALAVVAQVLDVRPPAPLRLAPSFPPPAPEWALAEGAYRHVSMFPPYLLAGGDPVAPEPELCGPHLHPPDSYLPLAEAAYRLGATFDAAYAARLDPGRAITACRATRRAVEAGTLDPATIYVVHPSAIARFLAAGADCGAVGDDRVCVARGRRDPFAEALRAHPLR